VVKNWSTDGLRKLPTYTKLRLQQGGFFKGQGNIEIPMLEEN